MRAHWMCLCVKMRMDEPFSLLRHSDTIYVIASGEEKMIIFGLLTCGTCLSRQQQTLIQRKIARESADASS